MDFLSICKRVRSECGAAGDGPGSVIGQSGELGRIVDWVKDAYIDIQELHPNWGFLEKNFSFNTVVGQSNYLKSTIPNLKSWKKPQYNNGFRIYKGTTVDETWLNWIDWDSFNGNRLFGSSRDVLGRPQDFTISPQYEFILWPKPDDVYTVNGEYYAKPSEFSVNSDTPIFSDYHMIIVWKALEKYASYSSEPAVFAYAQREFSRLLDKLEIDYLPRYSSGRPFA